MSGSMGNTAVSDSARAHAHGMLATVQTKESYAGVMATLNKEMNNRIKGLDDELQASKDSYRSNPAPAPALAHPQDDQAVAWARSNPNNPKSATILQANGVK